MPASMFKSFDCRDSQEFTSFGHASEGSIKCLLEALYLGVNRSLHVDCIFRECHLTEQAL